MLVGNADGSSCMMGLLRHPLSTTPDIPQRHGMMHAKRRRLPLFSSGCLFGLALFMAEGGEHLTPILRARGVHRSSEPSSVSIIRQLCVLKNTSSCPRNPTFSAGSSIQGQGIVAFTSTWGKLYAQDRAPTLSSSATLELLPHESEGLIVAGLRGTWHPSNSFY
jgi:hypothetical protein